MIKQLTKHYPSKMEEEVELNAMMGESHYHGILSINKHLISDKESELNFKTSLYPNSNVTLGSVVTDDNVFTRESFIWCCAFISDFIDYNVLLPTDHVFPK